MELSDAMDRALELAARGRGLVEPNPMVGAVLLRDGEVVGEGFHERFGGPHAEVNALADARRRGVDPKGLTMVVTLEPCSHRGKTGPCAEALIEAGMGRVVVAMVDPFPEVAGRGLARLREAGVEVDVGLREAEARRLNEAFIKRVTTGLPWVTAKWAQTVDGRTATASGDSQWISNERSRVRVHEWRGRVDAVMVGVGTAIADDPLLTARPVDPVLVRRVARRVVADRSGRLPKDAKLLHDGGPPVTVIDGELRAGLCRLAEEGVTNVLVEGGATLIGALLADGLVDQLLVFTAPKLIGDAEAAPAVRGLTCEAIGRAVALELVGVERLGDDVLLDYRVENRSGL
ncbi:MAG: bifunctional diaminohydroxyphosphoribosylaminopyrimidine deaminase/5-amino-6-(5-phosphoribosylamino)uracil reductase RibD [Planctomycetota bacterium]